MLKRGQVPGADGELHLEAVAEWNFCCDSMMWKFNGNQTGPRQLELSNRWDRHHLGACRVTGGLVHTVLSAARLSEIGATRDHMSLKGK